MVHFQSLLEAWEYLEDLLWDCQFVWFLGDHWRAMFGASGAPDVVAHC